MIIIDPTDHFGTVATCEARGLSLHGSGTRKDRTYFNQRSLSNFKNNENIDSNLLNECKSYNEKK